MQRGGWFLRRAEACAKMRDLASATLGRARLAREAEHWLELAEQARMSAIAVFRQGPSLSERHTALAA